MQRSIGDRVFDLKLVYSSEPVPLGTDGAVRNAADLIESDVSLVMNGNSYIEVDLRRFLGHSWRMGSLCLPCSSARGWPRGLRNCLRYRRRQGRQLR
jgi:hypothetical protein